MQGWRLSLTLLPGQCRRQMDHGKMTVDYGKPNQTVTPITAAVPDVVFFFEQVNISRGTWYAAVNLENAFFLVLIHKDHQKQFAFS